MPQKPKPTGPESIAAHWSAKYGEPIDWPVLERIASRRVVEQGRSEVSALRALGGYAEMLRHQRQEQIAFLDQRVPGEDKKLSQRLEAELAAAGERGERRRRNIVTSYLALLEGRVGRTKRGTPRRNVLGLSRNAHPTELLLALRLVHRGAVSRADEMVRSLLHRTPDWSWKAKARGADVALGLAAHEVSEWIRARHCNQSGQLDGVRGNPGASWVPGGWGKATASSFHPAQHVADYRPAVHPRYIHAR
jgi:hypothetical protein